MAAVAQSIELRATAALPTPTPTLPPATTAAPRMQSYFAASTASTQARDPRSPTASTVPATNGSTTSTLNSTPSLRVAAAVSSSNPELDEKLHSIEELLSQRKDVLLKRLQDHEPPRSADHHNQAHTPS
jgi:hypothetical protein